LGGDEGAVDSLNPVRTHVKKKARHFVVISEGVSGWETRPATTNIFRPFRLIRCCDLKKRRNIKVFLRPLKNKGWRWRRKKKSLGNGQNQLIFLALSAH